MGSEFPLDSTGDGHRRRRPAVARQGDERDPPTPGTDPRPTQAAAPTDARTGERGITDAMQAAIAAGVRFRAIPFSGYYHNVNAPHDIVAIERHLARAVS